MEVRAGPQRNALELGSTQPGPALNLGSAIPVPVRDYEELEHKPQVNGVELSGNKTTRQLRIEVTDPLSNLAIEAMMRSVFGE